jgi:hypothetical protein
MHAEIDFYAVKAKENICFNVNHEQINDYNNKGFDIGWTRNIFTKKGQRRKENLYSINCFYADIDVEEGEKPAVLDKIMRGLMPSLLVETKNGYHSYWYLKDPIIAVDDPIYWADYFREFTKTRIVPKVSGDPRACDVCRILRVPWMRYWKSPEPEFHTKVTVSNEDKFYSLAQIEYGFPKEKIFTATAWEGQTFKKNQNFWANAHALNVEEAFKVLSGTHAVNGEKITMGQRTTSGRRINIDSKPHHMWLDRNGKIGSVDGGGPGIPNWLFWYHHDWKAVAAILKEFFPDLDD